MSTAKPRSHNFRDLTTEPPFGKLTVIAYAGRTKRGNSLWRCKCECGGESVTKTSNLTSGKATSCGCVGKANLVLGHTPTSVVNTDGTVQLKGGLVCLIDPQDVPLISQSNWYPQRTKSGIWYARRAQSPVMMHVVIMGRRGVDHKNGNGLDNRRANLRFATHEENARNTKKLRTSGNRYKGVVAPRISRRVRYWQAQINIDRKQIRFGRFETEEEAARAYDAKAKEVYGDFARLNFPEES